MFCPNCGKPDQIEETYCRSCGKFLPDFDKLKKRETTPEQHLKINSVLSIMTAVVSLTLAILLYVNYLGEKNTPVLIYITAGFLTAMFAWQVQVFIRSLKLKKQIVSPNFNNPGKTDLHRAEQELLKKADFSDIVPPSVSEFTTKNLKEKVKRSTQTKH